MKNEQYEKLLAFYKAALRVEEVRDELMKAHLDAVLQRDALALRGEDCTDENEYICEIEKLMYR